MSAVEFPMDYVVPASVAQPKEVVSCAGAGRPVERAVIERDTRYWLADGFAFVDSRDAVPRPYNPFGRAA